MIYLVIKKTNSDEFTIILNNYDINIKEIKDDLKPTLKEVFLDLKELSSGYYEVEAFIDKNYGMVLEIIKEDNGLFNLKEEVDLRIIINKKAVFLFKVEDYFSLGNKDVKKYYFDNNFYYELKNEISTRNLAKLMENSELIYGDEAKYIREYGKVV